MPTVLFNISLYLKPNPLRGNTCNTQPSAIRALIPVGIFTLSPGARLTANGV